jgi:hypothetical protein
MHGYDPIEEPPPIERSSALPPAARKGFFIAFRRRAQPEQPEFVPAKTVVPPGREKTWKAKLPLAEPRPEPRPTPRYDEDEEPRARTGFGRLAAVAAIVLIVIGMQGWTIHRISRVRSELANAGVSLAEARGSIGTLWETTKDLDQDQMARVALLSDSIRSVFAYAQGQINVWGAAYEAQQRQLEAEASRIGRNGEAIARMTSASRVVNTRLDELSGADRTQQGRLDGLARADHTQATMLEALAGRTQSNETMMRDVSSTLSGLRQTLASLDGQLAALEDRYATSASAITELHTRVDGVATWVDGWRRTGLTGPAVEQRLASLADEVHRVSLRLDSMRFRAPTVRPAASEY